MLSITKYKIFIPRFGIEHDYNHIASMSWKNGMTEALAQYLRRAAYLKSSDPHDIYSALQELQPDQKRGMWRKIAESLNGDYKQVHDYFHNTWVKLIFDDYSTFQNELKDLATSQLNKSAAQIIDQFCQNHPDKHFSRR